MDTKKEQRAIDYLRSQLDMGDPQTVLVVYSQIIEQDVFHTQVGFSFLQELKDYLTATPAIHNADIPDFTPPAAEEPVSSEPLISEEPALSIGLEEEPDLSIGAEDELDLSAGAVDSSLDLLVEEPPEEKPAESTAAPAEPGGKEAAAPQKKRGLFRRKSKKSKEKKQPEASKKPESDGGYRVLFLYSLFVNLVLILMVIAMFVLTLTSDSPNIINYRTKIEDEYASWEQSLTEREQELRTWEQELSEAEEDLKGELYVDEEYEQESR